MAAQIRCSVKVAAFSRVSSRFAVESPTIDKFVEVLATERDWYSLGMFLSVSTVDLDVITTNYSTQGIRRCLIEIYKCLESKGKPLSWKIIAVALQRMESFNLANEILRISESPEENQPTHSDGANQPSASHTAGAHDILTSDGQPVVPVATGINRTISSSSGLLNQPLTAQLLIESSQSRIDVPFQIEDQFKNLKRNLNKIVAHSRDALKQSVNLDDLQQPLRDEYDIEPLHSNEANFEMVWGRVSKHYSLLNIDILDSLVYTFLSNKTPLCRELAAYSDQIEMFKTSAEMKHLVHLLKEQMPLGEGKKLMKLKLRKHWSKITVKKFEDVLTEALLVEYRYTSHMTVSKGCICVCWLVPDIHTDKLITLQPLELVRIIGVISLHIGSDVIYNNEGEGCETIEAAMLQAIELKNTRAIELLLAIGCNPEVATYNGDNAVTTIVNIRESKKSSVDHVCIIGHNEHVEAIVDPSSKPAECSSCNMKEKMVKRLHQQMNTSQETIKTKGITMNLVIVTVTECYNITASTCIVIRIFLL